MAPRSEHPWIDPAIWQYVRQRSPRPDPVQERLMAETADRLSDRAGMQISPQQGAFMALLVALSGARRALEVGTFTGHSALCVARALPDDGTLLCCDISEEYTAIARRYWEEAGVGDRIELRIGPALDTLRALPEGETFDVAFVDADKENYVNYYEEILARLRPGGLLMADNTLWSGRVLDEAAGDPDTVALRAFNDHVASDTRVESFLVPLFDGLTLVRKKPPTVM